MDDHNTRSLTDQEVSAICNALALVLVDLKKGSAMVDLASETETIDALHASYAQTRNVAEALLDTLNDAEKIVVHLRE